MPRSTGLEVPPPSGDKAPPPKLPQIFVNKPYVFWSPDAGLVVSPNAQGFPEMPSQQPTGRVDYNERHFVDNDKIYELFYPRLVVNRGPLFGRLDISNSHLFNLVKETTVATRSGPQTRYILSQEVIERWIRLENALIETCAYLLSRHPRASEFPQITYPRLPWEYGYRTEHASRAVVVRCAVNARDAFPMLSAVVTFALSLWLTTDKDTCFERAFTLLNTGAGGPQTPYQWLDNLEESYVCNLSSGMRTGGFINPFDCVWSFHLPHFVAAGVPMWLVWGFEHGQRAVRQRLIKEKLYPSMADIQRAMQKVSYETLQPAYALPPLTYLQYEERNREEHDVPFLDYQQPLESTGTVEAGSRQKHGETYEDFFLRMDEERTEHIKKETPTEKQSRESREEYATRGNPARSCAVFEWEQEGTFWRRVRVDVHDIQERWDDHTQHQRRYTGHLNEWDLCPQCPRYPPGVEPPPDEFDDPDYEPVLPLYAPKNSNTMSAPNDEYKDQVLEGINQDLEYSARLNDNETPNALPSVPFDFVEYLYMRHGFTACKDYTPNHHLHVATLRFKTSVAVATTLCYETRLPPKDYESSIVDFYHICCNPRLSLRDLPSAWDLFPDSATGLSLTRDGFIFVSLYDRHGAMMYYVRSSTAKAYDWVIATYDPTVILFAFRSEWTSVDELARVLLHRGISFYTPRIVPEDAVGRPLKDKFVSRGLGRRPVDYKMTSIDYATYETKRNAVLRSGVGRVCLTMGGLVARIARDVVPEIAVLDGPIYSDLVLCKLKRGHVLADDDISTEALDIVCGVYHVDNTPGGATSQHLSWWPKESVWHSKSGYEIGEWSPDAESWYQKRLDDIKTQHNLFVSSIWKQKIRKFRPTSEVIIKGSRRFAAEYIKSNQDV